MLRLRWNLAWHGGLHSFLQLTHSHRASQLAGTDFSPDLQLSEGERVVVGVGDGGWLLQQAVHALHNATSHSAVSSALSRLLSLLVCQGRQRLPPLLQGLDWESALGRFLAVRPSCSADEGLLSEVLDFLSAVLRLCCPSPPPPLLHWLGEVLYQLGGPLLALLNRSPADTAVDNTDSVTVRRSLDKQLLQFITTFNSKLPHQLYKRLTMHQLRGDLARKLIERLSVTDAPHFYNLASLEGTLQCLMHLTARPGFSTECSDLDSGSLCGLLLSSLLEVVTAFHIGRGGTAMSFMGKGVTRAAALCLRHLAFETATSGQDKDWVQGWQHPRQGLETEPALDWMLTLWMYRDPEVRAAGLGIAVALTTVEAGRSLLVSSCRQTAGGVWGTAFSILLDHSECSIVRQQAALLLVNLTSQALPSSCVETTHAWHGPVVMDTESRVTVSGIPALLALLQHSQFYQHVALMVGLCFTGHLMPNIGDSGFAGDGPFGDTTGLSGSLGAHSTLGSAQAQSASAQAGRGSFQSPALSGDHTPSPDWSLGGENSADSVAMVTPGLLAAVAQLLRNLLLLSSKDAVSALQTHGILPSLLKLLDTGSVRGHLTAREGTRRDVAGRELLRLYRAVLALVQAAVVMDTEMRQQVLAEKDAIHTTLLLMLVLDNTGDSDVLVECRQLWTQSLTLLTSLLQLQSSSALLLITQAATPIFHHLTDFWASVLEESSAKGRALRRACLTFLAVLCGEEGRWLARGGPFDQEVTTLAALLDTEPGQTSSADQSGDGRRQSPGSILCRCLVASYELTVTTSTDQPSQPASGGQTDPQLTLAALRTLLAISQHAKATALDMGLAERLIDQIKDTHAKLSLETLQPAKQSGKRKEEPLLRELVQLFDLLRNFMSQNDSVKTACHHSGLGQVLHRLWSWCQVDPPLMSATLLLLSSFTAHCPAAASSLAFTCGSAVPMATTGRGQLSSNSLVHALVKLAQREVDRPNSAHLRPTFQLLATLALSPECRNILWKSNFLLEFGEQNPKKTKRSKVAKVVESLWLELLVNLSFSTEGHAMILKVKDSVDLLVDFVESGTPHNKQCALLVLRNLCCHAPNKPRLLAHDKVLGCLLGCVEGGEDKLRTLAASSLWALCYNNQKAKVLLKGANVLPRLQESLQSLRGCRSQLAATCVQDLKAVMALVLD